MARDPRRKPVANVSTKLPQNLEEKIRRRAYELYETRGREEGHEQDDWLRAEAEIAGTAAKAAAA